LRWKGGDFVFGMRVVFQNVVFRRCPAFFHFFDFVPDAMEDLLSLSVGSIISAPYTGKERAGEW
jgi:hypothetical protein